jgi:5-methyltetrahydropteroyltriglutamate--homocysteine methyltransferase
MPAADPPGCSLNPARGFRLRLPAERIRQEGIDVLNEIAADLPGVTTGLHMCSANFLSKALVHGSYAGAAGNLFPRLKNFDVVFLEWDDSPRAGSFEVLEQLPADVGIMLGLVSTKRAEVERLDDVMKHVHDAARYVGLRRLGISPQCGFASALPGNLIDPDIQEQKLRLVTAAADVISEEVGSALR